MNRIALLAIAYFVIAACAASGSGVAADPPPARAASFLPPQVELRVPFSPTAFPSDGHAHLVYELYLTNFSAEPVTLSRVEVLDAEEAAAKPVASFAAGALDAVLRPSGPSSPASAADRRRLAAGATVIAFLWVALDGGARIPRRLRHRVLLGDASVEGALVATNATRLHVLGAPLAGGTWHASDGPGNDVDNHHRRGILVLDGRPVISRRYAIDWKLIVNGASFTGDARDRRAYYCYGRPVLSVADARVAAARDGFPENVPGHFEAFHPAVPVTIESAGGNMVTLDLGDGQLAHYFHLQPGSLRVKAGDRVRRGQVLARIGCSGDAREPHLHFEVTTSVRPLMGEGVPYVIDRYRVSPPGADGATRARELPLDKMSIDFPATSR